MEYYRSFKDKISPESFRILSVLSGLIVLMLFFSITARHFATTANLLTIALQTSIIAIIAIGQTFVIIAGGIDLSIGSNIAIAGVVAAILMVNGVSVTVSILVTLIVTSLIGALSGTIVVKGQLPPFIVTLGMQSIVRGAALLITGGIPVSGLPDSFQYIGNGKFLGVPVPVYIMFIITIFFSLLLSKTKFGNYAYATGSNLEATKLSGINTDKITILVYIISGFLAGCAGIIMAARIASGQPAAGMGYEGMAVASAVIGGTSLSGGEGLIPGTLIGALVIGVLRNGLNLLNISPFWQEVLIGAVIILAVYTDRIRHRKNN